jgi:hypothetical protein
MIKELATETRPWAGLQCTNGLGIRRRAENPWKMIHEWEDQWQLVIRKPLPMFENHLTGPETKSITSTRP